MKKKRILITVDEETLALLQQYKSWGKPMSWMVRYAVKMYEKSRLARQGGYNRPASESQESTYEEAVIDMSQ